MVSRRDVLRRGAGVASVGLVGSLAGCSDAPVVGSYFEDGGLNYPRWVYDPGTFELESVVVELVDVAPMLAAADELEEDHVREEFGGRFSDELDAEDVEYRLSIGDAFYHSWVYTGSFGGYEIVDELSVSEAGSYAGVDIYTDDEADNAVVGTNGEFLVRSAPEPYTELEAREKLEHLLDVYNGAADRFVETTEEFELVTDELGSAELVYASGLSDYGIDEADDDRYIASSQRTWFDDDEMCFEHVRVYEDADDIDLEEIESTFEGRDDAEIENLGRNDRIVTYDVTRPAEKYFG